MNDQDSFYGNEPEYRKVVISQLISYICNPGRFSVLLLGHRGVGKSHWLNAIQAEYSSGDCSKAIVSVNASFAKNWDEKQWKKKFKEADKSLLVIDDVEELSKETQTVLFEFLSTTDGKYGYDKKEIECRIVFTSTFDIETLREPSQRYLYHRFFDRISQLVVRFPSFSECNGSIWADFQATWEKMKFCNEKSLPGEAFKVWLEKNSHKFHGNFRDLDKLAINWHNCRLAKMNENDILDKVSTDFFSLYSFPEHKSELPDAFYINSNLDYDDNLKKFRKQYKAWVKCEYGSLRKGEQKAGISYRTMERW